MTFLAPTWERDGSASFAASRGGPCQQQIGDVVRRTLEQSVVVGKLISSNLLGDPHESLHSPIRRQAAAQEEEAVTQVQPLQQLGKRKIKVDVVFLSISILILALEENAFCGIAHLAMQLQKVPLT
jgi:hypothetical protein